MLTRFLSLVLGVATVWGLYRLIARRQARAKHQKAKGASGATVDMKLCKTCGAFVDAVEGCSVCG